MQIRSSSESKASERANASYFGYQLSVRRSETIDATESRPWIIEVVTPAGEQVINPFTKAKWISKVDAEAQAEYVVRKHAQSSGKDTRQITKADWTP